MSHHEQLKRFYTPDVYQNRRPITKLKRYLYTQEQWSGSTDVSKFRTTAYQPNKSLILSVIEFLVLTSRPNDVVICLGFEQHPFGIRILKDLSKYWFQDLKFRVYGVLKPEDYRLNTRDDTFLVVPVENLTNEVISILNTSQMGNFLLMSYFYIPETHQEKIDFAGDQKNIDDYIWKVRDQQMLEQYRSVGRFAFRHALLRFCPYVLEPGFIEDILVKYYKGLVIIPPFRAQNSNQTWLLISNQETTLYDLRVYNGRNQDFNVFRRPLYYENELSKNNVPHPSGHDSCYDCATEIMILQLYLTKYSNDASSSGILSKLTETSKSLQRLGYEVSPGLKVPSETDHHQYYRIRTGQEPPVLGYSSTIDPYIDFNIDPTVEYKGQSEVYPGVGVSPSRRDLCSEIKFLTDYSSSEDIVVLIGVGDYTKLVIELFPDLKFDLYDIEITDPILQGFPNIRIFNDKPDPTNYKKLPNVLLIVNRWLTLEESRKLYNSMSPKKSMLMFDFPDRFEFDYLDGEVFVPPWTEPQSWDTKLIPNTKRTRWERSLLRSYLWEFYLWNRPSHYLNNVNMNGVDDCYDCSFTISIIERYLLKHSKLNYKSMSDLLTKVMSF